MTDARLAEIKSKFAEPGRFADVAELVCVSNELMLEVEYLKRKLVDEDDESRRWYDEWSATDSLLRDCREKLAKAESEIERLRAEG